MSTEDKWARAARRRANARRAAADPSVVPHGMSGYNEWGCRCEICSGARSAYNKEYRARKKGEQ